jgi:hypothetical protein
MNILKKTLNQIRRNQEPKKKAIAQEESIQNKYGPKPRHFKPMEKKKETRLTDSISWGKIMVVIINGHWHVGPHEFKCSVSGKCRTMSPRRLTNHRKNNE